MSWYLLGLFLVTGAAAAAAPGPSILFVVSQSLRYGAAATLPTVTGSIGASVTWGLAVLVGGGALLEARPGLVVAARWAGAAYLAYLAVRQLAAGPPAFPLDSEGRRQTLVGAYAVGLSSPAVVGFYLFFIPQFVDPGRPVVPQMAALVAAQLAMKLAVLLLYVRLAQSAKRWLERGRRVRLVSRTVGLLLLVAAALLVLRRG